MPPSPPPLPGAFDFRRQAFFDGIGGIGYAVGPVRLLTPGERSSFALWIEDLRQYIALRVLACLSGDEAAISIAMLTGLRGAISDHANEVMRDAGLTHLLSISGTHVSMVVVLVFITARLLLALVEPLALRYPIKKWAALLALFGTLFYSLLVGTPAPTLRSCLSAGLVMFAVMVDRNPLSMRLLAWVAIAVMAMTPESVLGPSFQMSFGAVLALLAAYEGVNARMAVWRAGCSRWMYPLFYVFGVALSTVVATLATAPFGLFHFQRLATYGSAANLIAVPLTTFWIMPLVLLTYPLLPFGLEALAVVPMGWGVTAMLRVAEIAAGWPGSLVMVPPMPVWGLGTMVLGGLWLCLWRRPWRWGGLVAALLGLSSLAFGPQPDVLVSGDATLMAVRGADGAMLLSTDSSDRFVRGIWLRRAGQEDAETWPEAGSSADGMLSCDALGCLYRRAGLTVALDRSPLALVEDCAVADVVVATVRVPRFCQADTVIDRFDLWREGVHAIYLRPGGPVVETVADSVGDRPWAVVR